MAAAPGGRAGRRCPSSPRGRAAPEHPSRDAGRRNSGMIRWGCSSAGSSPTTPARAIDSCGANGSNRVTRALAALDPVDRDVLAMRYLEQLGAHGNRRGTGDSRGSREVSHLPGARPFAAARWRLTCDATPTSDADGSMTSPEDHPNRMELPDAKQKGRSMDTVP